jgi:hypothetical protein
VILDLLPEFQAKNFLPHRIFQLEKDQDGQNQELTNIFFKKLHDKYFRLCESFDLCCTYSALPMQHRQQVNKRAWLCSN